MKKILCFILLAALTLSLISGCEKPNTPTVTEPRIEDGDPNPAVTGDLMMGVVARRVEGKEADAEFLKNQMRFSYNLLRELIKTEGKQDMLISPLSVQLALAMTANGAAGETLSQMEALLGGSIGIKELNRYLYSYMRSLPSSDGYSMKLANSIWFLSREGDDFKPNGEFLQTNADWYGAQAYAEPFDETTLKRINDWVNEHTDGMIDSILEEIADDAVMYLINALAFDAEWQRIYNIHDIRDGDFTSYSGQTKKVSMMRSEEAKYIECGRGYGFIKDYKDQKYGFAVLLPEEGEDIFEYFESLTPEMLLSSLSRPETRNLLTFIPKFEGDFSFELNDALKSAGMLNAFDGRADLSPLAYSAQHLFLGQVLHKTYIALDERGTRAGAVTSVEVKRESASMYDRTITLDRPFVYMIIDNQTGLPLFMGIKLEIK